MIENENFQRQNNNSNLITNFYLFGVEPEDIDISNFENDFLKEDFLPIKLLSKFPPTEENILIDPNIIISHCFPKGYCLKQTMHDLENEYELFHFNLRNLLSTSYYEKRIYFTCCIFYENLTKYLAIKDIQKNMLNNRNRNRNRNNENIIKNRTIKPEQIFLPKLICISSFIPFPNQYRTILEKLVTYTKKKEIKIPIEKEIENIILGIPFPKKCVFYPTRRNDYCIDTNIEFLLRDLNQYNFSSYKMKSIFVFKIDDVLEIYKYILLEKPILFFSEDKEKLTNIVESFLSLIFPFEYQNPHCSILPDCNAGIVEQSKSFVFGVNEQWVDQNEGNYFHRLKLNLFKTVLICDIDREKVLFYKGYEEPKIMTFNELHSNKYPNLNPMVLTTAAENNLCEVNSSKENVKIPNKYSEKLKTKLKDKLLSLNSNNKTNYDYSEKSNEIITEYFYYFLVSILKNYNDYLFNNKDDVININKLFLKKNLKEINIETLFKANQFVSKEIDSYDDPLFFKILFETNLFKHFLFRKYRNSEFDKYDFLLFDETIVIKKNKNKFSKIKTEFINSKLFGTTVNYEIEKTQDFTKNEYDQINSKKKELINYYQKYDGKNLSYYIFPKLLYDDIFFRNQVNNRFLFNEEKLNQIYSSYENNQKKIDTRLYFKIYEGDLVKRYNFDRKDIFSKNEMNNIIGYLWLGIFCLTFYYCNDTDKKYRFEEMMNNLRNLEIPFTHKKILNFIYMTLIKYGNDYMIINFYDNLNLNDYDLYNNFCNRMLLNNSLKNKAKLNNLILKTIEVGGTKLSLSYYKDKDEDENNIRYSKIKLSLSLNNNKANIDKKNILPKRSFNSQKNEIDLKVNNNTDKEVIVFSSTLKCSHCNKEIDIYRLAAEIVNMPKQKELICTHCNKNYIPENFLSVGSYAKNIKIYNPYYLYHEICIKLMKKYGTRIDLDTLKEEYTDFYWNCFLYFSFRGYSYDMMIKYKNIEDENKDSNNNDYNRNNSSNINNRKGFFNLRIQRQNIKF